MNERRGVWQTIVAGVVIGVLISGCGPMTIGRGGGAGGGGSSATGSSSCPNPGNAYFPDCQLWCWNGPAPGNQDQKELLGHLIMVDRNPYCFSPASNPPANQFAPNPACTATDPDTWPKELTSPNTWKVLTEFDFHATRWPVTPTKVVDILRIMRVPYLIGHSVAKHNRSAVTTLVPAPPLSLGRENLLIGYARTNEPLSGMHDWGAVASCPGSAKGDSLALLAEFITINMMADGDSQPSYVDNWQGIVEPNLQSSQWSFRGANISVDYSFSFPVASRNASGQAVFGRIYVGYEGGGAY